MSLFEKITALYPTMTLADFHPYGGTIELVKEGDAEYIAKWDHPTLPRPTDEELA